MSYSKKTSKIRSETILKKAAEAAHHYGFCHISDFVNQNSNNNKKNTDQKNSNFKKQEISIQESEKNFYNIAEMYKYYSFQELPHPLFIYHSNSDLCNHTENNISPKKTQKIKESPCFGMHIIGVDKETAEAVILKAAIAVLKELDIENISISINSIGDSEASNAFDQELVAHFKRNLHVFPAQCRETFKKDTFKTLQCVKKHSPVLLPSLPKPMEFLNENSRSHLREVIEYLDQDNTPYDLDDSLIGSKHCYRETIFEIHENPSDQKNTAPARIIARGGRYSELIKKTQNLNVSSVGITLFLKEEKETPKPAPIPKQKKGNVWLYLIHIGTQARIKSLAIIEEFRKARIPVLQSITNEQISGQVKDSEKQNISHLLIIGQKEALENIVIVREVESQSQETVPVNKLINYIKRMKK